MTEPTETFPNGIGEDDWPKVGDQIGTRRIIRVLARAIVFSENGSGAYYTTLREWFDYESRFK